jgi:hypothetical protein
MEPMAVKIRINLSQAEIEIEGSEEFVEKHLKNIENYLQLSDKIIPAKPATEAGHSSEDPQSNQSKKSGNNEVKLPSNFGEWIHKTPSNATDPIKVVVAGYYIQKHSESNSFNSSSVNELLKDHGIKVANVSTTIRRLVDAKKIFQAGKEEGLLSYRLSRESEQELIDMIKE